MCLLQARMRYCRFLALAKQKVDAGCSPGPQLQELKSLLVQLEKAQALSSNRLRTWIAGTAQVAQLNKEIARLQGLVDQKRAELQTTMVVPMYDIDLMWHTHVSLTSAYVKDCNSIFGQVSCVL
jgi:hypothetical protein